MRDVRRLLVVSTVCVLTAIPPLVVAGAVARFAVDVPLDDQWGFAGEVIAWQQGEYTARRLWFPNGQHRVALPKLVMLVLAGRTGWDVRVEMWLDFAWTLLALGLLGALARRSLRPAIGARWTWVLPLLAAALFSLAGWESWTWSWMMAAYLNVVGVALAAWALGRFGARPAGVALMTLGAVVAALSFLSGFVLFALVPLALVVLPPDPATPHRGRAVAAACVVLALVALVYAATYPTMLVKRTGPPLAFDPVGITRFIVHYLGTPLAGRAAQAAFAWGAFGLALLVASAALVWTRAPRLRPALLPWLLLASYAVGSGALTAIGRMGGGDGLALASRYTTISALFWASLPPCALLAAHAAGLFRAARWLRTGAAVAAVVALVFAGNAYATVYYASLGALAGRQNAAREGRACLLARANAPDACLRLLSRNTRLVRRMRPGLAALHLGPFRQPAEPASGGPPPPPVAQGTSTTLPTLRRSWM